MNAEKRIQLLSIWPTEPVIEPIAAGRTNRNFMVKCGEQKYFARLGHDLPSHRINRAIEARCALFAAQYDVAPAVQYAKNGIIVTDYIEGRTLKIDDANNPAMMEQVAKQLAILHTVPIPENISFFDPADSTKFYLESLSPEKLGKNERKKIEAIIGSTPKIEPTSLIHADLIPENIIDDGKRLWFIDWEYSGIGHPAVDLAFIAMNFELSGFQIDSLVELHGDLNPELVRSLRLVIIAREALWSLVQLQVDDTPKGDLVEYSHKCLRRLEMEM
ncbi:MAG: phosphotransferase [Deltaproteobacteria bacterium]|nr:phosphotransferase [Deltaproteobacteria bacterium]